MSADRTSDSLNYPAPPLPEAARRLVVPLPPALVPGLNGPTDARWFCLTYEAGKAYLATDTGCGSTESWRVYLAFRDHLAIRLDTAGLHFGSDDARPDQAFLLDQRDAAIWVAPYDDAYRFLRACRQARYGQSPPLTPAEVDAALTDFVTAMRDRQQQIQARLSQDPEGTLRAWAAAEQQVVDNLNAQLTHCLPAVFAAYPHVRDQLAAQGLLNVPQQLQRVRRAGWN